MRLFLVDYDVGNLHSIRKALELAGAEVEVVTDMNRLLDAPGIVFPGVGAFDKTMERLLPVRRQVYDRLVAGVPALGICIGTQIMFEGSEEGKAPGLGVFPGQVCRLRAQMLPHMGWNTVESADPLFAGVTDRHFYFAHSYCGRPVRADDSCVIGTTEYEGNRFPSCFRRYNVYGTQFHPEKSAESGLQVLRNFVTFAEDRA